MRIRIVELATGYWQATFVGEEADAIIDRSPDQALASLVRANLRRLNIEEIAYTSTGMAEGAARVEGSGSSQGGLILPLGPGAVPDREERR